MAVARYFRSSKWLGRGRKDNMDNESKIDQALEIARRFGQIDGDHHKAWVIDQMVRLLTGERYEQWVTGYEHEDGKKEYTWDVGIAP